MKDGSEEKMIAVILGAFNKGVSNFSPIFLHMQLQIHTCLCSGRNN